MQYENYQGLIHSKMQYWYKTTGLEWEDCLSIANLGFAEACNGYKPEKGKFTTYLWRGIDIQFIRHLKHHNNWSRVGTTSEHLELANTNGQLNKFLDNMLDLSIRSQKVIKHILENPDIYCGAGKQVTRSNGQLTGKIAKMGYSWRTARKIIAEIKTAFKEDKQ
jgi:hypothetical protein